VRCSFEKDRKKESEKERKNEEKERVKGQAGWKKKLGDSRLQNVYIPLGSTFLRSKTSEKLPA